MIQHSLSFETIRGIEQSINTANYVHENWSDNAYALFRSFLQVHKGEFQAEDFRAYTTGLLPVPPSLRAYGGVILRARFNGLITKVDIRPVSNSKAHGANASVWKRV